MCGIAGYWSADSDLLQSDGLEQIVEMLSRGILYRGRDAFRIERSYSAQCPTLIQSRLAIFGDSKAAPPLTAYSRFDFVFNGEIYNVGKSGSFDKSNGDAIGFFHWLVDFITNDKAIPFWEIDGMFAFALFDREKETLLLGRDYFGQKPLFYTSEKQFFGFSSDPSALGVLTGVRLDRDSIQFYNMFGYFPSDHTAFKNVRQLKPGSVLTIKFDGIAYSVTESRFRERLPRLSNETSCEGKWSSIERYARDVETSVSGVMENGFDGGLLLSGGLDSSLVASVAASIWNSNDLTAYTIGFDDSRHDETKYAQFVASSLGLRHEILYITDSNVIDFASSIGKHGPPLADSSMIATNALFSIVRGSSRVCLTGDGGDELFAGYARYELIPRIVGLISRLRGIPGAVPLLQMILRILSVADVKDGKFLRLVRSLKYADRNLQAFSYTAISKSTDEAVLSRWLERTSDSGSCDDYKFLNLLRDWDVDNYLPNDLLQKIDLASMASGVEARSPLLANPMIENIISSSGFCADMRGKAYTKRILGQRFGERFVSRPKRGFTVPLRRWLNSSLNDWAESILQVDSDFEIEPAYREDLLHKLRGRRLSSVESNDVWLRLQLNLWEGRLNESLLHH